MILHEYYLDNILASLRIANRGLGAQLATMLYAINHKPFVQQGWESQEVGDICVELVDIVDQLPNTMNRNGEKLRVLYNFFSQHDSDIDILFDMLHAISKGAGDSLPVEHKRDIDFCMQILSCLRGTVVSRYESEKAMYKINLGHNESEIQEVKKRLQTDVKDFMLAVGMRYKYRFRYVDPQWLPQVYRLMQKYKSVALVGYVAMTAGLSWAGLLAGHVVLFSSITALLFVAFAAMSVYEVLFDYSESKLPGYVAHGVDAIELSIVEYVPDVDCRQSSYVDMLSDVSVDYMVGQDADDSISTGNAYG